MRPKLLFGVVLMSVWLWPGPAPAQPAPAVLTGVVMAPDGARLPGAMLRLLNVDSGVTVHSISSEAGVFRIPNLAPGRYQLDAELSGFEPRHLDGIVLEPSGSASITVRLTIAALHESVRVVASVPRDTVEAFAMRESRATDIGEVMSALPGVTKVRKGAIANDVVVRGFQGKDLTVLIDGQRIDGACPGHMDPPAFHVDFAEVNRVELSRDPFDVKNQGGLGGVVNIVTERPQRGWHGSANVSVGSAATLSTSAVGSVGASTWAALGGASARRADPYRDGSGALMTDRSGYRAQAIENTSAYSVWTAWGRTSFMPRAGTTLQVSYTRQSADAILYPYLQMDALFDKADRAGARLEIVELPRGWGAFAAHAYYTAVDHWMTDELRASGAGKPRAYSMGTRAKTAIAGGRAEIQRRSFSVGFEASHRNWVTTGLMAMQNYAPQYAVPDVTILVGGAFASHSMDVGTNWRLEGGARVDRAVTEADPAVAGTKLYLAYHGTTATSATDLLPAGYLRARWKQERGWSAALSAGRSTRASIRCSGWEPTGSAIPRSPQAAIPVWMASCVTRGGVWTRRCPRSCTASMTTSASSLRPAG
jgi:iron complex outermembrane receptor protein